MGLGTLPAVNVSTEVKVKNVSTFVVRELAVHTSGESFMAIYSVRRTS